MTLTNDPGRDDALSFILKPSGSKARTQKVINLKVKPLLEGPKSKVQTYYFLT